MKVSVAVFLITMAVAARGAAAEKRFTLGEAVQLALTNNLDLQAATYRIAEAQARVLLSGRLPNPEIESEIEPNVRGREFAFRFGFNQRLPVTARLRLERGLSRAQVKVAEAEVNDFRRKLAFEVQSAAARLASFDEMSRLHKQQLENTLAIARVTAEAAKVGEASLVDSAQLELAAGELRLQGAQNRSARMEVNRELASLLGFTNEIELAVEGALPAAGTESGLEEIDASIQAGHLARLDAAEEAVKAARASRWEDITVGAFTGVDRREDLPAGLKTDHTVGVRVGIPVPLWNNRKGRVTEAEATLERTEKETEAFRQKIRNEVTLARELMAGTSQALAEIRERLLPKARELEERLMALQKEGQAAVTEVLRARERRFEIEAAEINARRDYNIARARHMAATGKFSEVKP